MRGEPLGLTAHRLASDHLAIADSAAIGERAATPAKRDDIVINGRFYGQAVTGVQRYGREIVAALDPVLVKAKQTARLAMPTGESGAPFFNAIRPRRLAPLHGHAWEQAILPMLSHQRLLNLCNTGPVAKARQVVCIHDTNVFTQPEAYKRSFRLVYGALQPLLVRRAAFVATVSRTSAAAIAAQFDLAFNRIVVLPNGHEHALAWKPRRSKLCAALRRRPYLLLLGSRAKHKNIGLILSLAPAFDELGLDLIVAGGGARIFTEVGVQAAASANVRWLGSVSDDDLAFLFSEALCLAFPSLTEGFGLPIVEAMALRCPVVSSNRASMPEVCGTAALMASPDDPAAWLSHIRALAASRALGDEMRGRGLEQARLFSWTASAQGYFDLLERLA